MLGQLHPSSSLSHAPTSMAPLATPPPLTQPFPQTDPAPPPPPDLDMSHLGAIKKTVLPHPLAHSGLINDPRIATPSNPNNRPNREKKRPAHLKEYETSSITDKTSGKLERIVPHLKFSV